MDQYIGEIRMFGGTFAPQGWLLCDGSLLDSNRFPQLYSIIMEIYGGDGGGKFCVPDLRGRAPIHWGKGSGLSAYDIGTQAGAETVKLTVPQLPPHSHTVNVVNAGNKPTPGNNYFGALPVNPSTGEGTNNWSDSKPDAVMNQGTINLTGNGQPVNILSPVLAVTYIIAYEGIYPTRP